ncbi:MAG: right-handed parallel beta-helix repeat-containing protein [Acidimicrobiales bacterium]
MTIDATTQPGYGFSPVIELAGAPAGPGTDGLEISGDDITVRGLAISSFPAAGIYLPSTSDGARIEASYIGTTIDGGAAAANAFEGIFADGATNVTISGNVISGNDLPGIGLNGTTGVTITGNLIGTTADGLSALGNTGRGIDVNVASTTTIDDNTISATVSGSGVIVWGSTDTTLTSNRIGTDTTGNAPLGNSQDGVRVDNASTGTVIGVVGSGNVISGNGNDGIEILGATGGTVVQANTIGLGLDGDTVVANGRHGVVVYNGANTTQIGGAAVGEGNLVSGNVSEGIRIDGFLNAATIDNVIEGNLIGTDSTGLANRGNGSHGVHLFSGATDTMVGGTTGGAGNTIRFNGGVGVVVADASTLRNAVLGNSISDNAGVGIDLGLDGSTANDPGDGDPGPNGLLNFPVVTNSLAAAGTVTVDLDLDVPAGNYRLEAFTNASGADPSGYGEGAILVDSTDIVHSGSGAEPFSVAFAGSGGEVVTLTATQDLGGGTFGSTSEFSLAITVPAVAVVNSVGDAPDLTPGDGNCDTGSTVGAGDPECTLRAAIEEANAGAVGVIEFAIAGCRTELDHRSGVRAAGHHRSGLHRRHDPARLRVVAGGPARRCCALVDLRTRSVAGRRVGRVDGGSVDHLVPRCRRSVAWIRRPPRRRQPSRGSPRQCRCRRQPLRRLRQRFLELRDRRILVGRPQHHLGEQLVRRCGVQRHRARPVLVRHRDQRELHRHRRERFGGTGNGSRGVHRRQRLVSHDRRWCHTRRGQRDRRQRLRECRSARNDG